MTMTIKKLPAVLLAVIIAAALSLAMGASQQTAYAADKVDPLENYYLACEMDDNIALPGGTINIQTTLYDEDGDVIDPKWLGEPSFKWSVSASLSGKKGLATITADKDDPSKAVLKFKGLPSGQTHIDETVGVSVKLKTSVGSISSDSMQCTVCSDFERLMKQTIDRYMLVGDSATVTAVVLHYTVAHPEGVPVENVKFSWSYDDEIVKVEKTGGDDTSSTYTVTRLKNKDADTALAAEWDNGDDMLFFPMDSIPTDLSKYTVEYADPSKEKYPYYIKDGAKYTPEFNVVSNGYVLPKDKYELVVKRYNGYNEDTYEDIYVDASFPLTLTSKNKRNANNVRIGGTASYKITAKAAEGSGYKGEVIDDNAGFVFISSRYTLNNYSADIQLNRKYLTDVPVYPFMRYDVPVGVKLTPTVKVAGKKLKKGTDFKVTFKKSSGTGKTLKSFPTKPGEYIMSVTGKGSYYGVDDNTYVFVGKKNPMTVKGKTVKVKKGKTVKLKRSSVITVKKAVGKLYFTKVSGDKKITVAKNGKVTVKKGLKKGKTYKVKVKVNAAGDSTHLYGEKIATVKIKVK